MQKGIEYYTNNGFYLRRRKAFVKMEKVKIRINGVFINYDENDKSVYTCDEFIKISENKFVLQEYNNLFYICIEIGKFIYEKAPDLLEDYAHCYVIYKNLEHIDEMKGYGIEFEPDDMNKWQLNGVFNNLDINKVNDINLKNLKQQKPKYSKYKKIANLFAKWLETCGIDEVEYDKYNESKIISMEYFLHTIDLCLDLYKVYTNFLKYKSNDIEFNVTYLITNEGKIKVQKVIDTIPDLFKFMMLSKYSTNDVYFKECCSCNEWFFGKKNQKYCSDSCKQHMKYLLRKERKK